MGVSFKWLDEYGVGYDVIDRQHRYLFALANQIVDPNNDQQKTYQNVMSLNHYVREHFKDEEELMKKYNFPGYEEQVKEHDLLTKRLAEISPGIITGEVRQEEVIKFMRNWLLHHIIGKDVPLGDFLREIDAVNCQSNVE